jgi:hypothetical protein
MGMLLLLAASARLLNELAAGADGEGHEDEPASRYSDGLRMSLDYIDRAEGIAIDLGLPLTLTYRLFFERIKTTRRLIGSSASPEAAALVLLVRSDLGVLKRLSEGNVFWSDLVLQQERAMQLQEEAFVSSKPSPKPPAVDRFTSMSAQLSKSL